MNKNHLSLGYAIDGILFDWNGVLINDEAMHYEAFRSALWEMLGYELTFQAYQEHCQGRRDNDGVLSLAQAYRWQIAIDTCVQIKRRYYRERLQTTKVTFLPGAEELLAWATQRVAVAIVTSSPRDEVELLLQRSGQAYACHALVTAEDVTRGKPDPEGYLLAARMLDIHPERCLVVEDAPENLHGLTDSGFKLIGLGNRHHEFPPSVYIAATLSDIQVLLQDKR